MFQLQYPPLSIHVPNLFSSPHGPAGQYLHVTYAGLLYVVVLVVCTHTCLRPLISTRLLEIAPYNEIKFSKFSLNDEMISFIFGKNTFTHSLISSLSSPWRIVEDCGAAFAMGCIGGGVFSFYKGFKNSPKVCHLKSFLNHCSPTLTHTLTHPLSLVHSFHVFKYSLTHSLI